MHYFNMYQSTTAHTHTNSSYHFTQSTGYTQYRQLVHDMQCIILIYNKVPQHTHTQIALITSHSQLVTLSTDS